MDDNTKGILLLGGAVALIVLISKKGSGGEVAGAASVAMAIRSAGISAEIGDDLIAGNSYILSTTVTNQSTRAGVPSAADLTLVWGGNVVNSSQSASFAAGETKSFDIPFTVPNGMAGSTASFTVAVKSPSGITVASDTIQAFVQSGAVNYAASVVLGY